MIASKYEEICPPKMDNFLYVCDGAYSKEDILKMEPYILNELNFTIKRTSCMAFLNHVQELIKYQGKHLSFVNYILESSMVDYRCLKYDNLVRVAAAVFLVSKLYKLGLWKAEYE